MIFRDTKDWDKLIVSEKTSVQHIAYSFGLKKFAIIKLKIKSEKRKTIIQNSKPFLVYCISYCVFRSYLNDKKRENL